MKKLLSILPVIILLASGCGYSNSSQPAPTTQNPPSNILTIREWGVQLQKPSGMDDLQYIAFHGDAENTIAFTTQKLVDLDKSTGGKYCTADQAPIGVLSRTPNFDSYKQDGHFIPDNVKVGDYYYFFTPPQATCSDNKDVQTLETSQISPLGSNILKTLQLTR